MAKKPIQPIRWSAFLAAQEFHKTVNRVHQGLRAHGIEAGEDGRYSTQEIALAIFDRDALEAKAKASRWQQQIDEAGIDKVPARGMTKRSARQLS